MTHFKVYIIVNKEEKRQKNVDATVTVDEWPDGMSEHDTSPTYP
jgi:hypothetical protein